MATQTQNPETRIKKQINASASQNEIPLEESFFETDKELDPKYFSNDEQEALRTVVAYKRRQEEVAYGGTLADAIYFFMGQRAWGDRMNDYRHAAITILTALTDSRFNEAFEEKVGYAAKVDLVKLLKNTLYLMRDLEMKCLEPLLVMQEIKNEDLSAVELNKIKNEYEARLEMSLSGKHRHA